MGELFERLHRTPDGFVSVNAEVHTDGSAIIVLGPTPPGELAHDCDAMGCGAMHVIATGVIDWDDLAWRAKEIEDALTDETREPYGTSTD